MFNRNSISSWFVLLTLILVFSAGTVTVNAQEAEINEDISIDFGHVQWPGVTVKTHVARIITEYLGYDTSMTSGGQQVIFKGMEQKDLDVFLGNWLPTMEVTFREFEEKGSVKNVRRNLIDAVYKTAVNKAAYEGGVRSFEDLAEHAEKFDNKIYGLEPGNDGNIKIQDAIDENMYDLGDWKLVESSTAGMLSEVKGHVEREEWIAFNAWKPHYMNELYDIYYLEDPEGLWPEGSNVYTTVRTGFEEEAPNYYKFLEQFTVPTPIQNSWINEYQNKDRPPEEVAEEWIANNLDIVDQWVFGVQSVDGRMGRKVIREKVENQ
ncbi:MAG: ABC transporter substrate-binding protein [bacterium]